MELRVYWNVLKKYWVSILLLTIFGGLAAGAYVFLATPVYTAKSIVFLSMSGSNSVGDLYTGTNYTAAAARSYAQIATTPKVLSPVIEDLDLDTTAEVLATHVTTTIPANTSLIQISVTNSDADRSREIAQSIAESLVDTVRSLSPVDLNEKSTITATVVTPATTPTSQTSPKVALTLALGVIAGLVFGVALAILRKTLDVTIRSEEDVKNVTDHSVIATIPFDSTFTSTRDPLIMRSSPTSIAAEQFRRLRTNLQFLAIGSNKRRVFLVTSSISGEGKSTVAINIAAALAEIGDRVLLVDADMRRPSVARYLNLEGSVGLTTVLLGKASLREVIQPLGPGAPDVLPLGSVPPNPAELSGSRAMWNLIEQATKEYDTVIIDSAPLVPVTDTAILSAFSSGAIVVAANGKVPGPQLQDALDSLDKVNTPVMGIVMNMMRGRHHNSSYYYYYGTNTRHESKTSKTRRSGRSGRRVSS
ncbi:MAG: polysaccharide biosynthesis tyrosine autokinase [Propionibacteriaceae bacterium]|jgi:capsular exopolysaccharide synthesis family protein|nr:polysaccharide biosynthesis tyrosine autokinase [Propionibacteriaceae bacterium]